MPPSGARRSACRPLLAAIFAAAIVAAAFVCSGPAASAQDAAPAAPTSARDAARPIDGVLVIGTKDAPPFALKGEQGAWSGISIELWRRIAQELNLHYRFEERTLQGLIDDTAAGKLDAAVAAITVTAEREQAVDFTQPYYASGLGIAVPRRSVFDWWRLVSSLVSVGFLTAMLALLGVTVLIGLVIWLVERRHGAAFGGRAGEGIAKSLWWSASTAAQASTEHEPGTMIGRLVAALWMGASVIAVAVFTAGITTQFTARELQGMVHGVDDLGAVRVGAVAGTASLGYLADRRIRYRGYPDARAGLTALRDGKLDAFVYDRPILAWLVRQEFSDAVEVLDATFDKESYAIALPNGSPLRTRINLVMLELIHSRWWEELTAQYLGSG